MIIDYEKMVDHKVKIFTTIFPRRTDLYTDDFIEKVISDTDKIYEKLTRK